jgi:hypothetical protein
MQDDYWWGRSLSVQGVAVGSSIRAASTQAAGFSAGAGATQMSIPGHVLSALGGTPAVTQEKSMSKPPNTTTPTSARKHTATTASSSVAAREPVPAEP